VPGIKGGTETILVAEDNGDVRRFVRSLLSKYGYTVVEALDGEDALNKFKTREDRPCDPRFRLPKKAERRLTMKYAPLIPTSG